MILTFQANLNASRDMLNQDGAALSRERKTFEAEVKAQAEALAAEDARLKQLQATLTTQQEELSARQTAARDSGVCDSS